MNPSSARPLYVQIYEDLKSQINNDIYPVGSLLPSEKQLQEIYKVSRITVQKAVNELAAERLVARRSGKGTTILKKSHTERLGKLLGLILPGTLESFGDTLIRYISDDCAQYGYSLIIKFSNENQSHESECLTALVEAAVSGILIAPLQREFYTPTLMKYILNGPPIVILDKVLPGLDTMFVGTDHLHSSIFCATSILAKGHLHLGIIDYAEISNSTLISRKDGFEQVYAQSGHPLSSNTFCNVVTTNYLSAADEPAVHRDVHKISQYLLQEQPSCVIVLDSYLAYLAKQALYELKWDIPNRISLFGFDASMGSFLSSRYSHYQQDEITIASKAVSLIVNAIENNTVNQRVYLIEGKIADFGTVRDLRMT